MQNTQPQFQRSASCCLSRNAVTDERELMRDALKRSMGEAGLAEVRDRFEGRIGSRHLVEVETKSPARAFTTEKMIQYERGNVSEMRKGQSQHGPLVSPDTWQSVQQNHPHLSTSQRAAVEQILTSQDKIVGLEGVAGAGKTTSLAAIRETADREGYQVMGLAPTSRAAQKLSESGIESHTLQRHLVRNESPNDGQKRLFVIDESSLASTKQMNDFFAAYGNRGGITADGTEDRTRSFASDHSTCGRSPLNSSRRVDT
jgi:hypothetical protein